MNKINIGDKFQIKSKIYKHNGKYRKLIVTEVLDNGVDFTDVEDFGKKHAARDFISFESLEIYRKFGEVFGI